MAINASLYAMKCEPIKQKGVKTWLYSGRGSLKQFMEMRAYSYISSSIYLSRFHNNQYHCIVIILLLFRSSFLNVVNVIK